MVYIYSVILFLGGEDYTYYRQKFDGDILTKAATII